ncbi:hypothetical protein NPIL_600281 [Nephila pilipes]|uniref:Uncharacterized protein n=1 Tax=Nephila pilipes TaxID=299642 RepID=A0A8X6NX95_NEPPI|nr:hypothetical protein NPIL_600281 [Nephila pilipes]
MTTRLPQPCHVSVKNIPYPLFAFSKIFSGVPNLILQSIKKSSDFCAKAVGRWKGLPSRRAIGRGEFSSRGVLEGLDGVMRASIYFIVCIPAME